MYRMLSVVSHTTVTARGATATSRGKHQAQGNFPVAKCRTFLIDQFGTIAGMGLVAGTTAASLAGIGNMQVVQVAFAIPKVRIDGRMPSGGTGIKTICFPRPKSPNIYSQD